jgi:hypothetical protein
LAVVSVNGYDRLRRDALLSGIREGHAELRDIAVRAGERAQEPGACGDWSVRDVVAHIATDERWLASNLDSEVRPPPQAVMKIMTDLDLRNAFYHRQNLDRSWEAIQREADTGEADLLRIVNSYSEEHLGAIWGSRGITIKPDPDRKTLYTWPLWRWIVSVSIDHYGQHLPGLGAWLSERGL